MSQSTDENDEKNENGLTMELEDIDLLVAAYLKSRGYKNTIRQLENECSALQNSETSALLQLQNDESLQKQSLNIILNDRKKLLKNVFNYTNSGSNNPQIFVDAFNLFVTWTNKCLDCYRIELARLFYPLYVNILIELIEKDAVNECENFFYRYYRWFQANHDNDIKLLSSFIKNNRETRKVAAIIIDGENNNNNGNSIGERITYSDMSNNSVYDRFRNHKYQIEISRIVHQLLFSWLHQQKLVSLIEIIQDHIDFRFVSHSPDMSPNKQKNENSNNNDYVDSKLQECAFELNEKQMNWGMSRYMNAIENKALARRIAHRGVRKLDENEQKRKRIFSSLLTNTHGAQPKLTKDEEKLLYRQIQNRIYADKDRLPSILSYRCVNSFDRIICVSVSLDGRYIAVGCNDSVIRLFDVTKITGESNDLQRKQQSAQAGDNSNNNNNNNKTSMKKSGKMEIEDDGDNNNENDKNENDNNNNNKRQSVDSFEQDLLLSSEKSEYHCVKLIGHKGPVFNIEFNPVDSNFFLSCSSDGTVRLWSSLNHCCLCYYQCHLFAVWNVIYSPLGYYFATISNDRTCKLFTTDKTKPLRIFVGHLTDVNCVAFHPNCNYIATGSSDRTIRVFDIQSGQCIRLLIGHKNNINDLVFTNEGRCLVSASSDKTIRAWDLESASCIAICKGHKDEVTNVAVAYSVDVYSTIAINRDNNSSSNNDNSMNDTGNAKIKSFPLIVSSSLDGTIKFWDVNANQDGSKNQNDGSNCVKTIETHNMNITFLKMTKSNLVMTAGVAK